jgi:hypothetical protein
MTYAHRFTPSRRGFCLCCLGATTFAASGGWLSPGKVFAQARGIVESMRAAAASAPIIVHRLRGNVSVLEGSGRQHRRAHRTRRKGPGGRRHCGLSARGSPRR